MTFEEYHAYSDVAIKLFNFMNGYVNRLNSKCTFQIEMYDLINGTYGNIRFPCHIYINLGTIIDAFEPAWSTFVDKWDYTCTLITWSIAHELHHADQLIAMLQYSNTAYRNKVEGDVQRASYDWVADHAKVLSQIGGFNVIISSIDSYNLPDVGNYKRAGLREFYLQTIENILIRDTNSFRTVLPYIEHNANVRLTFNSEDTVFIKTDGNYNPASLNRFSALVYKWAGYYDKYSIRCFVDEINIHGVLVINIEFEITNQLIEGMIFKNNR